MKNTQPASQGAVWPSASARRHGEVTFPTLTGLCEGSAKTPLLRHVATVVVVTVAAAVAVFPAAANPPVADKQAEAARVLAQVDELDHQVGKAAEAYNGAALYLQRTTRALGENTRLLHVARGNLKHARAAIAKRVVQLYTDGDQPALAEIMLGAQSLDDLVTALDAQERIVAEDARIARDAARFAVVLRTRQEKLGDQKDQAERLASEKAEARQRVEAQLRERERLLGSIRNEIARLREAERAEQARLAREVRARVSAQDAADRGQPVDVAGSSQEAKPPTDSTPGDAPPAQTGSPPPARYASVVAIAMRYLGVPYKWGGASPQTGFDCSGFTLYVYAQIGVTLPHYTGAQWQLGTAVSRDELQPGDLVFFNNLGHEGIYIGNNQMIHAPRTGDVVKISPLTGWYDESYYGARRL